MASSAPPGYVRPAFKTAIRVLGGYVWEHDLDENGAVASDLRPHYAEGQEGHGRGSGGQARAAQQARHRGVRLRPTLLPASARARASGKRYCPGGSGRGRFTVARERKSHARHVFF